MLRNSLKMHILLFFCSRWTTQNFQKSGILTLDWHLSVKQCFLPVSNSKSNSVTLSYRIFRCFGKENNFGKQFVQFTIFLTEAKVISFGMSITVTSMKHFCQLSYIMNIKGIFG